ncbi:MAG: TnpV protein [Clostridia bacterium]|nr:TnpV protein [Clostridia bacterium]
MKDEFVARVGVWGQRHYQYLKECKPSVIGVMRLNGSLNAYLQQVNEQADEMCYRLVKQMAKDEGVTDQLKAENPME